MDDISSAQVCEIIKQITDEGIKSYIFKVGNYNDHCFVTLKSDEKYVIRISRKGWTQNDRKIEKFMRERIAGELIGERAKISTPRTLFIDGSLRIIEAAYAIQTHISGILFRSVFHNVPVEEQIELLQLYGETVKKIHEIDLPMWWEKDENFAYMKCSPTLVRCLPESITPLIDRFDGESRWR